MTEKNSGCDSKSVARRSKNISDLGSIFGQIWDQNPCHFLLFIVFSFVFFQGQKPGCLASSLGVAGPYNAVQGHPNALSDFVCRISCRVRLRAFRHLVAARGDNSSLLSWRRSSRHAPPLAIFCASFFINFCRKIAWSGGLWSHIGPKTMQNKQKTNRKIF